MKRSKRYIGRDLNLVRIDLEEWQEIEEKLNSIPPKISEYIDIHFISQEEDGVRVKIKAKNYVGILPISEDILITVRPKAPIDDFLYVLYKARKVKIDDLEEIEQAMRRDGKEHPNIFSFLIYALLVELEKIKSDGFLKTSQYYTQDTVVKGKLLVKQTLNSWLKGNKSKVICGNFELSKDNPQNRGIKFTLWMLLALYYHSLRDEKIRNNFFEKYMWFKDIPLPRDIDFVDDIEKTITYQTLPNSRNYYYDILNLCMFFITHSTLDFISGKEVKVKSFVVDMNKVFEEYIYNVLKEKLNEQYEVEKPPKRPLFDDTSIRPLFDDTSIPEVKPDYLILKNNKPTIIADAKYKKDPTNEDFYQLLVYAERYDVTNSLLICPSWSGENQIESYTFKGKQIEVFHYNMLDVERSEEDLITTIKKVI